MRKVDINQKIIDALGLSKNEGISLKNLRMQWNELAPENYVRYLKDKKVRIILSESDKVIPYHLGRKFTDEILAVSSNVEVKENRFLGHYGTVLSFCFLSRDILI